MTALKHRIKEALIESRILILGCQILWGFQFRALFENSFTRLPRYSQYLNLMGLGLLTITITLIIIPSAYHRIVENGEDSEKLNSLATRVMDVALLPFASGLTIQVTISAERVGGVRFAMIAGIVIGITTLFFWYGIEIMRRKGPGKDQRETEKAREENNGGTELKDKIDHVLTELRIVLPGAQALLGFQFAVILMEGFDILPSVSKWVHLASLVAVALSIILLMTPAAYHRIVNRGEETQEFDRLAGHMLIAAMVPLAIGIAGDSFVVMQKVTDSFNLALAAAAVELVLICTAWFGITSYLRYAHE